MNKRTPAVYACMLAVAVVLAGHAPELCAAAVEGAAIDVPIVFAQVPADGPAAERQSAGGRMSWQDYGEGGRIVRLEPDGRLRVLSGEFASACECDVSFNGDRILFAGCRNAGDPWDIWEMNADGSEVRPVTHGPGNCRRPIYLGTLYTLDGTPTYQIAFVSDGSGVLNERGSGPLTSLYACRLDGSGVRRLTFNLSNDTDPAAMADGRILLASRQGMGVDRHRAGRVGLFAVQTDGMDYSLLSGEKGLGFKLMPCVTLDGLIVFVENDQATWDGAGRLACVSLRRTFNSHRLVPADGQYLYHSPAPLPGGGAMLASRRPGDGSGTHAVCRVDSVTGQSMQIYDDSQFHDFHAKVLAPHPEPDGRSSSVNEKFSSGKLYCLNVNTTEPTLMPYMRPGIVRRLRVIEGVPMRSPNGTPARPADAKSGGGSSLAWASRVPPVTKRLIGDIPVEADGSFQIELPADVPVQLQTLDENGMALRSCGWIWAKPREWRGCIGCHEDPERVPENELVEAVRHPAINLMLPESKRRTVDFRRDVMPIIASRCATANCHGGAVTPDPTLRGENPRQVYAKLLAGLPVSGTEDRPAPGEYVHPGRARTSPLVWRLFGRNTSRPWDAAYDGGGGQVATCPPPGAAPLTAEEKTVLIEWIDLGAMWSGPVGDGQDRPEPHKTADRGGVAE